MLPTVGLVKVAQADLAGSARARTFCTWRSIGSAAQHAKTYLLQVMHRGSTLHRDLGRGVGVVPRVRGKDRDGLRVSHFPLDQVQRRPVLLQPMDSNAHMTSPALRRGTRTYRDQNALGEREVDQMRLRPLGSGRSALLWRSRRCHGLRQGSPSRPILLRFVRMPA